MIECFFKNEFVLGALAYGKKRQKLAENVRNISGKTAVK
jgi:hypothetical protein